MRFGWIAVLLTTLMLVSCDQPSRPATRQGGTQPQGQAQTQDQSATRGVEIAGVLQRAKDGDSFDFRSDAGESLEVRLEGIDCPEKGQAGADQAKRWLENVTNRRRIWVIPTGKDKYGRTLASVHNGEIWINGESIRLGLAWHYAALNRDARLARLQMDARAARAGIWQSDSPTPPWEFRKRNPRK